MIRIAEVEPRAAFKLWLRFEDGTEGDVDLADIAGKGVFSDWDSPGVFERVERSEEGALTWPGGPDLCADALYMRLTGKSPEEVFPRLRSIPIDA
jgi:hypothetical protein